MVAHIIRSFADCERAMLASQTLEESSRIIDLAMGLIPQTPQDLRAQLHIQALFFEKAAQCPDDQLVQMVFQRTFNQKELVFDRFRNTLLPIFENALVQHRDTDKAFGEVVSYLVRACRHDGLYFSPQFSIKLGEHPEFNDLHLHLGQLYACTRQGQWEQASIVTFQTTSSLYALPSRLQQWFDLIAARLQRPQAGAEAGCPPLKT